MTHAGLACLLAGMLLMGAWTGSPRFAGWRVAAPALGAAARSVAFVLLAAGFAGKAGVIPLHVWLPLAHPAAPSHVSALMSGVMIKLGVYGLLRAGLDWLGVGPAWWGVAVLLAGTVSSVIGVLYALVDHDLKRLLAFSSIENVGIILIGAGAGMLYHGAGLEGLALLALAAALYHTLNHAAFKALLFLGAGAVVHATGTRNMEGMGGLIKRMPWTAACFLVGSAAIAALPPLNGFVSEWLTFVALLQNTRIAQPILNLTFTLGIAALALPLIALRLAGAARGRRPYETWGCGRMLQTSRMEYTATAFADPFRRVFDFFYRPEKRLDIEFHPGARYFVQRIEYANPTRSIFDDWLYRPAIDALRVVARRARAIQSGSANVYLAYILAALIPLLVLA